MIHTMYTRLVQEDRRYKTRYRDQDYRQSIELFLDVLHCPGDVVLVIHRLVLASQRVCNRAFI